MSIKRVVGSDDGELRSDALADLRDMFPPGAIVNTLTCNANRNNTRRTVIVLAPGHDGTVLNASWSTARVMYWDYDDQAKGVRVRGAGTSAGLTLVRGLAHTLYGDHTALSHNDI